MNGSMIAEAINNASKAAIKVENTPDPPKEKEENCIPCCSSEYYDKPSLYLDTKDFSGVKDFKGGEKVTLCIECLIESTDYSESIDEKGEKKERSSARLQIQSIADITQFSKSEFLKK